MYCLEYQGLDAKTRIEKMLQQLVVIRDAMVEESIASAALVDPLLLMN